MLLVAVENLALYEHLACSRAHHLRHSPFISTAGGRKEHTKTSQEGMREGTEGEAHLAHLLLGLAERERLGLREVVAEQDAVVQGAAERIVRRRRGKEVRRDELRTLVQQLVERVLPVRAGRAPNNWLRHAQ